MKMLIQTLCLKPVAAVNDKRVHEPNVLLEQVPGVEIRTGNRSIALDYDQSWDAKIFIWQRPIMAQGDESVRNIHTLLRAGYLIVLEYDDYPERWSQHAENGYLTFKGVHAIQTSTKALAEYFQPFNPEVRVFPNQILKLPSWRERLKRPRLRIVFGALNRQDDWRELMPSLNTVIRLFPEQLEFQVIFDKAFYEALETPHKHFHAMLPYQEYLDLLQTADVALLPLQDSRFNQYKSDLKFLECAACGAVALASSTVYQETVMPDQTGVLFTTEAEFVAQLTRIILLPEWRHQIARTAYQWVAKHRLLDQHIQDRLDWYLDLNAKKQQLTRQLLKRHRLLDGEV